MEYINKNLYKPKAAKGVVSEKSTKRSTSKTSDQSKGATSDLKDLLNQLDDQDTSHFIEFSEIRDALTGIARVIEYTIDAGLDEYNFESLPPSKYLKIQSIMEGEIEKGYFEGFSRTIDSDGTCTVGFYSSALSNTLRGGKKTN